MSKHAKTWLDWTEPPAGKDEQEAIRKVAAEIERLVNVAGYTPPPPIGSDSRKDDLTELARRREKQREIEHDERIAALEAAEAELKEDHKKVAALHKSLKKLADDQEAEQRQLKKKERDRESADRLQASLAEGRRRAAAAAEAHHARARHAQWSRDEYVQGLQNIIDNWNSKSNPPPEPRRRRAYV